VPRLEDPKTLNLPIDFFFRALALDRGSRAIGVVLSGTASDGTEGLKVIKEACGITFAQEPGSAKFSEMPRRAIEAGAVDFCLPIPKLAQELMRLARHPYVVAAESTPSIHDPGTLKQIFALVEGCDPGRLQRVQVAELRPAPGPADGAAARRLAGRVPGGPAGRAGGGPGPPRRRADPRHVVLPRPPRSSSA
jgi:hypothetical protein